MLNTALVGIPGLMTFAQNGVFGNWFPAPGLGPLFPQTPTSREFIL
jgi:hypothetical protein